MAAENWDDNAGPVEAEVPEIHLFGRWSCDEVQVSDISLTVRIQQNNQNLEDNVIVQLLKSHWTLWVNSIVQRSTLRVSQLIKQITNY